jgi:hypothetical protein
VTALSVAASAAIGLLWVDFAGSKPRVALDVSTNGVRLATVF